MWTAYLSKWVWYVIRGGGDKGRRWGQHIITGKRGTHINSGGVIHSR